VEKYAKVIDRIVFDSFDFVHRFLEGALKNQEVLRREIFDEVIANPDPNRFHWLHVNIQTYSQHNLFNELMRIIPEFMVDVRNLVSNHYSYPKNGINDTISLISMNDFIGSGEWQGFMIS
jgi:hypothetical protein